MVQILEDLILLEDHKPSIEKQVRKFQEETVTIEDVEREVANVSYCHFRLEGDTIPFLKAWIITLHIGWDLRHLLHELEHYDVQKALKKLGWSPEIKTKLFEAMILGDYSLLEHI